MIYATINIDLCMKTEKILRQLVIIILVAAGMFLVFSGYSIRQKAQESLQWKQVKGTVILSHYHQKYFRRRYVYAASLSYQFKVNETWRIGSTYSFTDRDTWFYGEDAAQAFVAQYPVGSTVVVFYDPQTGESVLKPGVHGANNGLVAMALGKISFIGAICFLLPLLTEIARTLRQFSRKRS